MRALSFVYLLVKLIHFLGQIFFTFITQTNHLSLFHPDLNIITGIPESIINDTKNVVTATVIPDLIYIYIPCEFHLRVVITSIDDYLVWRPNTLNIPRMII